MTMAAASDKPRIDRRALPVLISAAAMLSLAMGLRQSLGLFMTPMTRDIAVSVSDFTLAIAVQNLMWGIFQPIVGAYSDRIGFRPLMVAGAALYAAGLAAMAFAEDIVFIMLGPGLMVGAAMACTANAIALSVSSRVVPPAVRSTILGVVSAGGSIGALIAAPLGQFLIAEEGWRFGAFGFAALALVMIPAAWIAGRADRWPIQKPVGAAAPDSSADDKTAGEALVMALSNPRFVIMTLAFFVCGMQLVFLTTHLPSYIILCGMDPMLGATALGVIGGFNILGSLFFGWAGQRWNKQALLGLLYISRSLVLAAYFMLPPTPEATILFAAAMGFLWLGVSPLIAGAVIEMFGLRWQAMLQGVMFVNHQVGSFLGAYGGGWVFDAMGSYDLAFQFGISIGLTAGIIQVMAAFYRPPASAVPA